MKAFNPPTESQINAWNAMSPELRQIKYVLAQNNWRNNPNDVKAKYKFWIISSLAYMYRD